MLTAIESEFNQELSAGEEMLWSGVPDPMAYASRCRSTVRVYVVLLSILEFLLVFAVFAVGVAGGEFSEAGRLPNEVATKDVLMVAIFLLIPVLFAVHVLLMPRRERRKAAGTRYALTTERVIRIEQGKHGEVTREENAIDQLTHLSRVERPSGFGDLRFHKKPGAGSGYADQDCRIDGFYGIPDVREVERLLLGARPTSG